MTGPTALPEKTARLSREQLSLIAALVVLAAAAWGYLLNMAADMANMAMPEIPMPEMSMNNMADMAMDMTTLMPWSALDVFFLFIMWAVMMVAMMLPSAAPMILTFQTVNQRRPQHRAIPTYLFVSGYLAVWILYSGAATLLQWFLHHQALINSSMEVSHPLLSGGILIGAGVFQWTRLKERCLTQCRSPLMFLMAHWREGAKGAFTMGLHHGSYCTGCCWLLMLVLFVAGVMNLFAVLLIAMFVLAEKLLPHGILFARISGVILIMAGCWQFYR